MYPQLTNHQNTIIIDAEILAQVIMDEKGKKCKISSQKITPPVFRKTGGVIFPILPKNYLAMIF
jgi:hypothetical protein